MSARGVPVAAAIAIAEAVAGRIKAALVESGAPIHPAPKPDAVGAAPEPTPEADAGNRRQGDA